MTKISSKALALPKIQTSHKGSADLLPESDQSNSEEPVGGSNLDLDAIWEHAKQLADEQVSLSTSSEISKNWPYFEESGDKSSDSEDSDINQESESDTSSENQNNSSGGSDTGNNNSTSYGSPWLRRK